MHMLFMEAQVESTPTYILNMLFNEAKSKYMKTPEDKCLLWWHNNNNNNNRTKRIRFQESLKRHQVKTLKMWIKKRKHLRLQKKQGKLGDTKQWIGKTYHFCPANHMHSHWHTHKVKDCNTFNKMNKNQPNKTLSMESSGITNQVTVDKTKMKKGMAAIFSSGDFDTDDIAEALATTMAGVE